MSATAPRPWFLARALRALHRARPHLWAVIAFADPTPPARHRGIIYRAANALFYGYSRPQRAYRDGVGALHSARQGPVTLTDTTARARGWTVVRQAPKYRYLFLLGGPLQRHFRRQALRTPLYPYPADAALPVQLALPLLLRRLGPHAVAGGVRLFAVKSPIPKEVLRWWLRCMSFPSVGVCKARPWPP